MYIFDIDIFWFTISPSYYGLMYAISFIIWYLYIKKIDFLSNKNLEDLFLYVFLGVILWWRIWYILFYNLDYYLDNLQDIIKFWEWWMSFHWWFLWVLFSVFIFSKVKNIKFFDLTDKLALVFPIGLFFWRIWNYINKELLWYEWYNWFLSVKHNWLSFFPSTLLEAFLEWVILFLILNYFYYKKYSFSSGFISWLFLIFYGSFRTIVEMFFRTPDSHIWYIYWYFTIWEILSFPMIISWIIIVFFSSKWKINRI